MLRSQLMKDFEETFKAQDTNGHMNFEVTQFSPGGKKEYFDDHTRWMFTAWVCAFETYSEDKITGD